MSRRLFRSVIELLDQLETLRTSIHHQIQQIECEHNALLQQCQRGKQCLELDCGHGEVQCERISTHTDLDDYAFDIPEGPIDQPATGQIKHEGSHRVLSSILPHLEHDQNLENMIVKQGGDLSARTRYARLLSTTVAMPNEVQRAPHPKLGDPQVMSNDEFSCEEEKGLESTMSCALCATTDGINIDELGGEEDNGVERKSSASYALCTTATDGDVTPKKPNMRRSNAQSFDSDVLDLVWPVWTEDYVVKAATTTAVARGSIERKSKFSRTAMRAGDEMRGNGCMHVIVTRPSAPRRALWDVMSILALGYDVIVIPLVVFDLQQTYFMRCIDLATLFFWSLDVMFSFVTGFHENGILEMRVGMIARRYLRTWFAIDAAVLMIDYFLLFMGDGSFEFLAFARIGKGLRVLRLLRVFRLLRLLKARAIFTELSDLIFSEATAIIFRVLKLLFAILLVNHVLACGWYAVGHITFGDDSNTWVKNLLAVDNAKTSFAWFYTSSLHWSITQFTPASMEIVPCNFVERCYALCVILFALVAFSSFVSSITSSMTHFRTINMEHCRQQQLIRQFITQNRVSVDLGNRIQIFLRQTRRNESRNKRVHGSDISAIGSLPEALRMQLHAEVFEPVLVVHSFFFHFHEFDETGLVNICHNAMSEQSLSFGQSLFVTGEPCDKMFFILSGRLDYMYQLNSTPTSQRCEDEYVCEMGLWLRWEHQGRLVAAENCEAVGLDSRQFRAVACKTVAYDACKIYAKHYVGDLFSFSHGEVFDISLDMARLAFEAQIAERNRARQKQRFAWLQSASSDSLRSSIF